MERSISGRGDGKCQGPGVGQSESAWDSQVASAWLVWREGDRAGIPGRRHECHGQESHLQVPEGGAFTPPCYSLHWILFHFSLFPGLVGCLPLKPPALG